MLKKTISLLTLSLLTLILIIISPTGCTPNIEGKYVMNVNEPDTSYIEVKGNKISVNNSNKSYECSYKLKDNKLILDGSNLEDDIRDFYLMDYIYCDDEDFDFIYGDKYVSDGIVPDKDYFDVTITNISSNLKWEYVFTESGVCEEYAIIGTHRSKISQGTYKRDGNFLLIKEESLSTISNYKGEKYYYIKDGKLYTDVYVKCS